MKERPICRKLINKMLDDGYTFEEIIRKGSKSIRKQAKIMKKETEGV